MAGVRHTFMDRSERVPRKPSNTKNKTIPACLHPRAMAEDSACIVVRSVSGEGKKQHIKCACARNYRVFRIPIWYLPN